MAEKEPDQVKPAEDTTPKLLTDEEREAKFRADILLTYQTSSSSIQDIARINRLTVVEVLEIIGQTDLISVETVGDQIDQDEAGPEVHVNPRGRTAKPPFSLN